MNKNYNNNYGGNNYGNNYQKRKGPNKFRQESTFRIK